MPRLLASTRTCQTCTRPVMVKTPSASASSIEMVCVTTMMRWRFPRSATVPASGASTKTGIWLQKAVTPSSADEPVSR